MAPLPTSRFPATFELNSLALATRRARASGRALIDLTLTNPTRAGFVYPRDLLLPMAGAEALTYEPTPFGAPAARNAVAADYARRGIEVHPDRIILTASTSEAYAWLFRLLCRPTDDEVLIPTPSYPLFEHLTMLDGVRAVPYRLDYHAGWSIDFDSVERAWSDEVRAMLVVSPNNPTGSVLSAGELETAAARCAYYGAGLIVDEVFADFPLTPDSPALPAMPATCLSIRLGGLSKSAGLPQVKLGWMAVDGPESAVAQAMERLELIADTYLSVSTPVQVAAPSLIAACAPVRAQIVERIRRNDQALRTAASASPAIEVLQSDAGWSSVLRLPATRSEEEVVVSLLEQDDVIVHPGFFFDFPQECYLVVSLLPEPGTFDEGIRRLLARVAG
jgi:aspartate/methionine/tyrosine aminotransferase